MLYWSGRHEIELRTASAPTVKYVETDDLYANSGGRKASGVNGLGSEVALEEDMGVDTHPQRGVRLGFSHDAFYTRLNMHAISGL